MAEGTHMRLVIPLLMVIASALANPAQGQTYRDLIAQANSLYERGEFQASAESFERALALQEGHANNYYNAACSWALAANPDKAFAFLEQALDRGYRNTNLLSSDSDLSSLRDDERWESILARCREAEADYLESINVELYEMFQADQNDRRGDIDWDAVAPRDEERRRRAMEMVENDLLSAPDDFVHAAFIFQHGSDSTSYRIAHELASKAVALDSTHARARWIAAATKDRYLQSVGKPQIYGTQFRLVEGVWTLEPIDTTAVTDAERAWWGVPPLARQRARAAEMNAE